MKAQARALPRLLAVVLTVALALAAFASSAGVAHAAEGDRTITDDAGREVTIPSVESLEKIYFTSPIGQIFCFTLAPELCAGTTMDFTEQELANLPEGTDKLPNLGTLSGGGELNPEAILAEGIQLIFSITSVEPGESDASFADDLQNQTGIPVVVLNGSFDTTAACYESLGELLGKQDEAKAMADYCTKVAEDVAAAVASVPEDERVSVYYAEGPDGLQTEPTSSTHALVFKLAGAENVAKDLEAEGGKGRTAVSLEQVLAWNPDVIVSWDDQRFEGGADELIRTDPNWSEIKAVKDGRVYTMVQTPFSWLDRPPAVNRFIGLQWLTNLLYPEAYDIDIVATTQEFYSMFYHRDLTEEQVIELLGNSYTPADGEAAASSVADEKQAA
ncbi:MAG: ABC transporter substrate-binding protein [Coriobacteriia bacterium]|nr:ABC transporter substrate-binding protein [Coriobacteriia bacterium]MBS5477686.1 ABC transporter substrate-binding protein [Coriobacteriia bacterium]